VQKTHVDGIELSCLGLCERPQLAPVEQGSKDVGLVKNHFGPQRNLVVKPYGLELNKFANHQHPTMIQLLF
jgi:hypothetical protein